MRRLLGTAVLARVDLSTDVDRAEGGSFVIWGQSFTLQGLPRILLFDPEGRLIRDWNGPPPKGTSPPHDPRDILDACPGGDRVEMDRFGPSSICCGGGGGRIWMETPPGARFGDLRVRDAMAKQADVLVTACPYCTIMLDASNLTDGSNDMEILDIAEIIDRIS